MGAAEMASESGQPPRDQAAALLCELEWLSLLWVEFWERLASVDCATLAQQGNLAGIP
jgi:hypothetical protein